MHKTFRFVCLLLIFTLNAVPLPAQHNALLAASESAGITGTLYAPGNVPVADVEVRLRRQSVPDMIARTDGDGEFSFSNVRPGRAALIAVDGRSTPLLFIEIKRGVNRVRFEVSESPAQGSPEGIAAGMSTDSPRPADAASQQASSSNNGRTQRVDSLCQAGVGQHYTIDLTRPVPLINVLEDLHHEFGVNFVADPAAQQVPVRVQIRDAPWTSILRVLLELNDLEAECLPGGIVRIVSRAKQEELAVRARKNSPLVRATFRLRYLRPNTSVPVNLAGQPQTGGGAGGETSLGTIEEAIRKVLRADGDTRGEVSLVPGTSEFIVIGTQAQIDDVADLITRVDRPQSRIEIRALIYTASENKLRDIGVQLSGVAVRGGDILGGITTLPAPSTSGSGTTPATGGLNPRGVPSLPGAAPSNSLSAAAANTLIGGSSIIGTVQFNLLLSLAQQRGFINVQSRPFGVVRDGGTLEVQAGQSIPVVTTGIAGGATVPVGSVQFIPASRIMRITPQVAEVGVDGRTRIVLTVQLENNTVNTALGTFGTLPAIDRQSLQTEITLADAETGIIGGIAVDSVSRATSRTPGLADVPLLGRLFERNQEQVGRDKLYFAITARVLPSEEPVSDPHIAPADALTAPPPPPSPQQPSPYERPRKLR